MHTLPNLSKPVRPLLAGLALPALLLSGSGAAAVASPDWPGWRGPQMSGSTDSGRLPHRWDPQKPLWKVSLPGKGSSTPIVWGHRILLTAPADEQDTVLALDRSGKLLWQTAVGSASNPKHRTLGSSCNASPVTDGQAVYVYFRSGRLAALASDGTLRWKVNLAERFGPEELFWDQGSSPVLTERHIVMARMHGGESWVAGFDRANGELAWLQPRNYSTPVENNNGYSTPLVYREGNLEALLLWGADCLTAHNATDGSLLWSCAGFNPDQTGYWPAIATPVILGNIAVVPAGRDDRPRQARVHGIRLGGNGDVTESHRIWKREDLGVFVTSPAAYQGSVYLLRHRGEVVCLDPATGETLWTGELPRTSSSYYASPLIAAGILYAAREDGTVFTARVGDRFELLSEMPMGERIVASPVPAGHRLLLRTDDHLFCLGEE